MRRIAIDSNSAYEGRIMKNIIKNLLIITSLLIAGHSEAMERKLTLTDMPDKILLTICAYVANEEQFSDLQDVGRLSMACKRLNNLICPRQAIPEPSKPALRKFEKLLLYALTDIFIDFSLAFTSLHSSTLRISRNIEVPQEQILWANIVNTDTECYRIFTQGLQACTGTLFIIKHANGDKNFALSHFAPSCRDAHLYVFTEFFRRLEKSQNISPVKEAACIFSPPGVYKDSHITKFADIYKSRTITKRFEPEDSITQETTDVSEELIPVFDEVLQQKMIELLRTKLPAIAFYIKPHLCNYNSSSMELTTDQSHITYQIHDNSSYQAKHIKDLVQGRYEGPKVCEAQYKHIYE